MRQATRRPSRSTVIPISRPFALRTSRGILSARRTVAALPSDGSALLGALARNARCGPLACQGAERAICRGFDPRRTTADHLGPLPYASVAIEALAAGQAL